MAFEESEVRYVAALARLSLTDEEIHRFSTQLKQILSYVDKLNQLKTDDISPTSHGIPMQNVFRKDEVIPSLDVEKALSNAPAREGPFFLVPRVIEDA
ncbi:MAG: Asp-tRNA(Asn)/Glu-tRNA(Gln) amidotransferase subunit GatC [Candidatus Omnitrophica bacterium]|nr:Asp-tRNA(Asn)/Glu-tRNA(Gln) amidotransferase subunit GatC [Candidatus Omnitrophota bacterium]